MTSVTPVADVPWLDRVDERIAAFMNRHGTRLLRYALAIVFIWFGALKFTAFSPATDLASRTMPLIPREIFIPMLAAWEVLIGICLLFRPLVRFAIALLAPQMIGTFLPLVLLPGDTWTRFPWAPTLEGQYIIKNLVIIAAAMVIGGTVRRSSNPDRRL